MEEQRGAADAEKVGERRAHDGAELGRVDLLLVLYLVLFGLVARRSV